MHLNPLGPGVHPQFYEASFTILLAICLAGYTLVFGQPGRARRLFVALVCSIIVWSGGVAMSRWIQDPNAALSAVRVSFVGIFALPPLWFALALQLTGRGEQQLARRRLALLAIPSLLAFAVMATNGSHHLYMRDPMSLIDKGPKDGAGPLVWVWAGWAYALVFGASIRYVAWSWQLVSNDARWRGGLVCMASILPLGANIAHLCGWTAPDHDVTPLLLGAALVMLFVADWRFRMLDALPVARRDVIEQLHDGVIVADARGIILDMNPAAEMMLAAPLTSLKGQPLVRSIARQAVDRFEFDVPTFDAAVTSMCDNGGAFDSILENYAGRLYEIRASGVCDDSGRLSGLYIIMRDITERSRFEEVVRESRRARSIASLAAGITHEVNNPLSYVRANVRYVMEALGSVREKPDDEVAELESVLAEGLEGIDRIGTIVERIRKFTHTRGGVRETLSVAMVVEEAARIQQRTSGTAIELVTDVEPDIRPAIGFRDGLLEAILSLLDNARQALSDGQGVIRLSARQVDHVIRIEVEDDGPGVPEALRDQIFEPFFTTMPDAIGTGLGLPISEKLVSEFGGSLSFEPVATGGARFVIELPDTQESTNQPPSRL